ncbi:hypothetical protein DFH09DRAFT_1089560 [Mycena vulgaris]|nr:hypothetical protein DFH09DRAFT_1089560 [Mycena vulgaris]
MVRAVARELGRGIALILYPTQPGWCARRLKPLHDMLEAVFSTELPHARKACRRYCQSGETRELDNAWGIYFDTSSSRFHCDRPNRCAVFQKLEKQLPQVTALDLQYVSPELLNVRNPGLAVPGTIHLRFIWVLCTDPATVCTTKRRGNHIVSTSIEEVASAEPGGRRLRVSYFRLGCISVNDGQTEGTAVKSALRDGGFVWPRKFTASPEDPKNKSGLKSLGWGRHVMPWKVHKHPKVTWPGEPSKPLWFPVTPSGASGLAKLGWPWIDLPVSRRLKAGNFADITVIRRREASKKIVSSILTLRK